MTTKSVEKANTYLVDGRVLILSVDHRGIEAAVRGSEDAPYIVVFRPFVGWHCDCPARIQLCAHVIAVARVTNWKNLPSERGPDEPDPFEGLLTPD